MKKITITQKIIDEYPHKTGKNRPHRPYCKMCSNFDNRIWIKNGQRHTNYNVRILEIEEEAIEVHFRNGTIAYYCLECWNNPANERKRKSILKQDYGEH